MSKGTAVSSSGNDQLYKLKYLLLRSRSLGVSPDTYSKHKAPSLYPADSSDLLA